MDRRFLTILVVIVLIFVGVFALNKNSSNKNTGSNNQAQPTTHVEGQGSKGVTLVEYGDYECPVCEAYYQPLKQVYDQFSKDIYFQFRNLPLTSIHPNAFAGARAAEAAGLQGKYWQMHDLLYENQSTWSTSNNAATYLDQYAQQLGLNMNQFKQDYSSDKVNNAINADVSAFLDTPYANHNTNNEATPTFFLDGKYISNSQLVDPSTGQVSVEKFANLINAEIAKKAH